MGVIKIAIPYMRILMSKLFSVLNLNNSYSVDTNLINKKEIKA